MLARRPFTQQPKPERAPRAWPGLQSFKPVTRCDGAGTAHPKENVVVSEAYRNIVRGLPCMRCGYPPRSQFCHTDEGKGAHIKTDDRRGWAGCGPRIGSQGCHFLVGTSGTFAKAVRRALDDEYAAKTRETVIRLGLWPKNLPEYGETP